jgi:chemotaxis protein methyltransferase CheR
MQNYILRSLGQKIFEHCGINYMDNLSSLESKILRRLTELRASWWEYCDLLSKNQAEWDRLIECITINETYFFREEAQLHELSDVILPQWSGKPSIKIWSAACSTGEEPYSLSMAIADRGSFPLNRVEILATDINKRVLGIAERGYYPKHSLCFRRTSAEMLDKYFSADGEGYRVKEFIRECVRFDFINLIDELNLERMPPVDIIFCRNVLIYFDDETTRNIIHRFYRLLNPGGYLFLGHAETILGSNPGFETISAPNTFYYRKPD